MYQKFDSYAQKITWYTVCYTLVMKMKPRVYHKTSQANLRQLHFHVAYKLPSHLSLSANSSTESSNYPRVLFEQRTQQPALATTNPNIQCHYWPLWKPSRPESSDSWSSPNFFDGAELKKEIRPVNVKYVPC